MQGHRNQALDQQWRGSENLNPNDQLRSSGTDPYAPSLVYDLLQGKNEWKNIQDIVKLTFKAVCDTVKSQGSAIRDLERQISDKVNQHDFHNSLSLKANVSDVSRTIADLQTTVDHKLGLEDVTKHLDEFVTKQDIQYMLSNKVSVEELTRVLQSKSNVHEVNMDISQINQKVDELMKDTNKRL